MQTYFSSRILLPSGWSDGVEIEVDDEGCIHKVQKVDAPGRDSERLHGAVIPGVPNVHSHSFQRGMAGLAERGSGSADSFWSWRETLYDFVGRIDPEALEAITTQLYIEMLKAGYTSVAEFHYLHNDPQGRPYEDAAELSRRVIVAARRVGMRITHLPTLYVSGGFGRVASTSGQRRFLGSVEGILEQVRILHVREQSSTVRIGGGLHSLRAVPPAELRACVQGLEELDAGIPLHIHVAEQEREVEECIAWSGARPVQWLLDHIEVCSRWCLIHATHMSPVEITRLARSGAVAGLCTTTEANLGDGFFPFPQYVAEEGKWGIGSDSQVAVSPTTELRWLEYGQRLITGKRNVVVGERAASSGATLLAGAWEGGRLALGQKVGRIEVGSAADWVVLDVEHAALLRREGDQLLDAFVFVDGPSPVCDVMVGGRWVVKGGKHELEEEGLHGFARALKRLVD